VDGRKARLDRFREWLSSTRETVEAELADSKHADLLMEMYNKDEGDFGDDLDEKAVAFVEQMRERRLSFGAECPFDCIFDRLRLLGLIQNEERVLQKSMLVLGTLQEQKLHLAGIHSEARRSLQKFRVNSSRDFVVLTYFSPPGPIPKASQ